MTAIVVIALSIYASAVLVILFGLLRARVPAPLSDAALPRVSVVVAARNEEHDLPRCLASLERLDYPRDRLEFLLVDDESSDGTRGLLEEAARRLPNARVLSTAGWETHLRAKARPLALGIANATGAWVFTVDADAAVEPRWLRAMLAYAAPDIGLLGGPFVAEPRGLVGGCELGVEAYIFSVPFGIAGLGGAALAVGGNMAIRRDVYESGGGLESEPHEVAEDLALLRLVKRAGLRTGGGAESATTVRVVPASSFGELLQQQKRWILGGVADAPPGIKAAVFVVGAFAWLGSFLTLTAWWFSWGVWGFGVTARFLLDVALAVALARSVGLRGLWRWLPVLEVYLVVGFLFILPWCIVAPKPRWSGARLDGQAAPS